MLLFAELELHDGRKVSVQPGAIHAIADEEITDQGQPWRNGVADDGGSIASTDDYTGPCCLVILANGKEYLVRGKRDDVQNGIVQGVAEINAQLQRRRALGIG
jgi:hypothetical protein